MAAMSDYLENKLIDAIFRGGSFTFPTTIYVALCTTTPTDASTGATIAEVSGGNYARASVTANNTEWAATNAAGSTVATSSGTGGTTSNNNAITWASVTWSATVTSVAVMDSATLGAGNMLFYGALGTSKTVSSGDTLTFSAANLSIQIDN